MILISVDTLRQDHLGCYGYGRDTSPNLDRFAREDAVVFESACAQAPYTLTSHMSMLTGLYPEAHGVLNPVADDDSGRTSRLPDGVTTLAEALHEAGFVTEAFTDGIFLNRKYGFDQGFDRYRDKRNPLPEENGFRKYRKALHAWIRAHGDRDFFLFIHTYDTHAPYVPPPSYRSKFRGAPPARDLPSGSLEYGALLGCHSLLDLDQYVNLQDVVDVYDGCIAFVDHEIGRLFALLREMGLWEDALIVFTSDHGESFMENGLMIGHGLCATNEETRVPLLIKFPGSPYGGRRVDHVVESVDIMPTVLSCLGISVPPDVQGQDLLEGLEAGHWQKSYAYGTSPESGRNHYLVRNGIKFIEGVNDPTGNLIRVQLLPMNPPNAPCPGEPYYEMHGTAYFYDFEHDPLGLAELFYRGDRAYDLHASRYEYRAERISDEKVLLNFKKAARALAAESLRIKKKYAGETSQGAPLSEEEMKQLAELGYGGVLASSGLGPRGGAESADAPLALKQDPLLTDRSLLNRGDEVLWIYHRMFRKKKVRVGPRVYLRRIAKARSLYLEFRQKHPDKTAWVEWRLKTLDQAEAFVKERFEKGDAR